MSNNSLYNIVFSSVFCLISSTIFTSSWAQSSPSILTQSTVNQSSHHLPIAPSPGLPVPAKISPPTPTDIAAQSFVLHSLDIDGSTAIPLQQMASAWNEQLGKTITVKDIYSISDRIAAAYTKAGYSLFGVTVPAQNFADGHVHVHIIEGFVDAVEIQGEAEAGDLTLLRGYVARIIADRPLRQATLERYISLISSIPGFKVTSDFQPMPGGAPGAVKLRLAIKAKKYEYGIGIQNQGQNILGQTQATANAAVNNLLRNGDRTQLVFSVPLDLQRFQYLALNHVQPLGTDGATVTFSGADLLTHPVDKSSSGNAFLFSAVASYPLIRAVHEIMVVNLGIDTLNSDNGLLGRTLSDERTRSIRLSAYYVNDTWLGGTTQASVSLSQGVDVAGARRGTIAYGGPVYTKATLRLSREQPLPWGVVLRVKTFMQVSDAQLPASEQFAFGGTDFGQALQASSITGDRAVAAAIEFAHPLPDIFNTKWNSGTEGFAFVDGAYIWNAKTLYQLASDRGATTGVGICSKLLDKVTLQLAGATVLKEPLTPGSNRGWRLVINVIGNF